MLWDGFMNLKVLFAPSDLGRVVVQDMTGVCVGLGDIGRHMGVRIDLDGAQVIDGRPFDGRDSFIVNPLNVVLNGDTGEVLYTPTAHIKDLPSGWQEQLARDTSWPPEKYRDYARVMPCAGSRKRKD